MFVDYFVLGCTGFCLCTTFFGLKKTYKDREEKKTIIRKLQYGEVLDIRTVLGNIDRIHHEAVNTFSNDKGSKNHLLVLRGKLQSDSSLASRFRPQEKLLIKVHLWMTQGTAHIPDQHPQATIQRLRQDREIDGAHTDVPGRPQVDLRLA